MWNKLFRSKSKENRTKKNKFSNVIKSFSLSSNKDNSTDGGKKGSVLSDSDEGNSENVDNLDLKPCPICGRTFLPPALIKHAGICEKMNFTKRKPFDSFRQRREGTELENYLPVSYSQPKHWPQHGSESKVMSKSNTFTAGVTKHRPLLSQIDFERKPDRLKPQPATKDISPTKPAKRSLGPVSERCPHCDRSFGIKAYDRHVEWCKEKSRLKNPCSSNQVNLAKERLEARTKYKAPNLKSKREKNREKYSGLSESVTSLTESLTFEPFRRERKNSNMSISMTSSVTSDGGFSDKYDPFVSAKRQLEDLFSPTIELTTSTPIKTPATKTIPLSTSLNLKSPLNPSQTLNANKSNFRRTSSLRAPKRNPTPIAYSTIKYKPTIQRGISDEGPISSNFMKPEEYDELPVKSHAIITPDLVPKSPSRDLVHRSPPREIVRRSSSRESNSRSPSREISSVVVKRDQKSSQNRRNLRLDIKNPNSPSDYPLTKTDSLAAFLMYENDVSCSPEDEENLDTKENFSEKDIKEKNNCLNKLSLSRNLFADLLDSKIESGRTSKSPEAQPDIIQSPKHHSQSIKLSPIVKIPKSAPPFRTYSQSTNEPAHAFDRAIFDDSSLLIKSQMINSNDNLKINACPKLSDSMSTSSFESHETTKPNALNKSIENIVANQFSTLQRINSGESTVSGISGLEKRSLKRQLKLNKDNFLYDDNAAGADNSNVINRNCFGDDIDGRGKASTLPPLEPINYTSEVPKKSSEPSKEARTTSDLSNIESLFDDFDFEEFISSFEDDEQYPIFKNYKELMTNRTGGNNGISKYGSGGSSDGESTSEEKSNGNDEIENTQPISQSNNSLIREIPTRSEEFKITSNTSPEIDILKRKNIFDVILDSKTMTSSMLTETKLTTPERDYEPQVSKKIELPVADDGMSQAEKDLLTSVHELNQMCESNSAFHMDSGDELSSAENLSFSRSVGSKLSADSAYGSLCRQSPIEKPFNPLLRTNQRRPHQTVSYQIPEIIGGNTRSGTLSSLSSVLNQPSKSSLSATSKIRCPSSSGSESSLPPIITHKNDSQNIYNTMNNNAQHLSDFNREKKSAAITNQNNNEKDANGMDSRIPKFCYECGAKYIVVHAKFCMECGVKRVYLD